jgi:hypothetical protein
LQFFLSEASWNVEAITDSKLAPPTRIQQKGQRNAGLFVLDSRNSRDHWATGSAAFMQ